MKKLFFIEDTITNKISYYHILFFLIALPFDRFYSELILISFTVHTLIHVKKEHLKKIFYKEVIILQSIFLITLYSTIYTRNTKEAFLVLERMLTIFLFPVLFSVNEIDFSKYQSKLLMSFSVVCTLSILYLYYDAFHIIYYNHLPFSYILSPYFINHNFSMPIDMHATFLSLYVALALICFLVFFFKSSSLQKKLLYIVCMAILFCGLIQLGSKSILLSVFLIIVFIFPFFYFSGKQRFVFITASSIVIVIITMGILKVDSLKNRYMNGLKDLTQTSAGKETTDTRIERWEAALELIRESPVAGYGSGDEVDLLKDKYYERKLFNSYLFNLNAHNQYLSFTIKSGIVGLLTYIGTLLFGFFVAIKSRNILFLSFLVLIAVVSLSESFLDANKGVFFFSFFFSFFIIGCKLYKRVTIFNQ